MSQARGLIFDLDGTLVHSLPDIRAALNHALASVNRPAIGLEQVREWVGGGLPALCRRACPEADEATLVAMHQAAFSYYAAHLAVETAPFDNILKMLNLLRELDVRMAVLSNKPHALAIGLARRLDLAEFFEIVQGYVVEEDRKPSPKTAREIAGRLGGASGAVAMVGDSPTDVKTARAAGLKSVAVTWGYSSRGLLEGEKPDFWVAEPLEIVKLAQKKSLWGEDRGDF